MVSNGFGVTGISWAEIKAWSDLTMTRLQPWQAEAIKIMSRAYANEYESSSGDKPTDPPWADEESMVKRVDNMTDTIKTGFRALIRSRGQSPTS